MNDLRPLPRLTARLAAASLTILFASTLAATPLSATPGQEPPPGGIGLRLLEAPVATQDDPRARIYVIDHLAPGTTIERRVEISNTTDTTEDIVLYPAAATIEDGTFLGAAGRTANDLSSWTTVTPEDTTVPAGGRSNALVTIAVPDDAAPGEQYAVVWAEARSAPDGDGGVVQVSRVGIRLYISVGAGGPPAADFEIRTLTAERSADGTPIVSAAVENTGGRALDMTGTLALANGPGGLGAGPFPVELGSTLAVGETETVRITLDEQLPDGPWDAHISLSSGLTERSAEATLSFSPASAGDAVPAAPPGRSSNWLAPAAAVALLGLLLVILWAVRRHSVGRSPSTTRAAKASATSRVSRFVADTQDGDVDRRSADGHERATHTFGRPRGPN